MLALDHFQLFLFDFDGLLVNTEELHYQAYQLLCKQRGYHFSLDFASYSRLALFSSDGIQKFILGENPIIEERGPLWSELYLKKKALYGQLIREQGVELMAGVEPLLAEWAERSCIVTNANRHEVESICEKLPILKKITRRITREDYALPKPHPDSYVTAIARFAGPEDNIIGFEDSPRGLTALLGTRAEGVLVSGLFEPSDLAGLFTRPYHHIRSFKDLYANSPLA